MKFNFADRSTEAEPRALFVNKMRNDGVKRPIIDLFSMYYHEIRKGTDGFLREEALKPVADHHLVRYEDLDRFEAFGRSILPQVVRIVLNGGLGTSMGLKGPKSLLTVKSGQTFMDIILNDIHRTHATLCLMNSHHTHAETCRYMASLELEQPPLMFFQHQFPKILRDTLMPANWPEDKGMEWNPAGHGDIYNSLYLSGMLDKLLNQGVRYAFISNSDNLGAVLDSALLGYFARTKLSFLMEVARRMPSDAKGGHLAIDGQNKLLLRESAQCPPEDRDAFQNIHRHRFFNTNNLWVNLVHLKNLIKRDGLICLPMMLNPKHLDPRNETSPQVYQVETAMGTAISLFEKAEAVQVPRHRFLPVKTTNDLLVMRSDRFTLSSEKGLTLSPGLEDKAIQVNLDGRYYKNLNMFEERFDRGIPDLSACDTLSVHGNVFFENDVTICGNVTISSTGPDMHVIPRGAVIGEGGTNLFSLAPQ